MGPEWGSVLEILYIFGMNYPYEQDIRLIRLGGIWISSIGLFILVLFFLFRNFDFSLYIAFVGLYYILAGIFAGLFFLYKVIFVFLETRPRFHSASQRNAYLVSTLLLLQNIPLSILCLIAGNLIFMHLHPMAD